MRAALGALEGKSRRDSEHCDGPAVHRLLSSVCLDLAMADRRLTRTLFRIHDLKDENNLGLLFFKEGNQLEKENFEGSWADRSPLHEAASQGRLLALRTLLSQGYNVNAVTIDNITPLHEACLGDHAACARTLLEAGANANAITVDGVTPLFNACSQGSASCVELLLEYGAKAQPESCLPSPTHEAASKGHHECLDVLIAWGIDVDQHIHHLGTPLYVACMSQQYHCVWKLLYAGADVHRGRYWDTPLHAAAQKPSTEIVNLLLEFGADINAKNTDLLRPVDMATSNSAVERLLLQHEATPSSLCQLCRLCIRNYIGRQRLHLISQLQLPTLLQNFIQYR
uniref:ankyrin repeat and SOCS box protein 5 isoform X2 n=1 Tax=Myodes glareolus TaxID=447135 RepID=UPI00202294EB|nr:ankyrin repeat and SOCS box protein 5 isoform X2 [Myodes glareolus]